VLGDLPLRLAPEDLGDMTTDQVDGFFQTYARAFSKGDVAAICGLWDYPSVMSYQGRHVALDREAFRRNIESLCAFYAASGLARAKKQVLKIDRLTETTGHGAHRRRPLR
jgi:hypothetical protein